MNPFEKMKTAVSNLGDQILSPRSDQEEVQPSLPSTSSSLTDFYFLSDTQEEWKSILDEDIDQVGELAFPGG